MGRITLKQKTTPKSKGTPPRDSVQDRRAHYVDDARANRLALDEILEMLAKEPWKILRTPMHVKSLQKSACEVEENSIPWPTTYTVHRKIPKYWLMLWMVGLGGPWTAGLLEQVDKLDGQAVGKLIGLGTGVAPGRALNAVLRNNIILSRFYTKLESSLGGRLRNFPRDAIQDGVIDWTKVCVYTTSFCNDEVGRYCSLSHIYQTWTSQVRLVLAWRTSRF